MMRRFSVLILQVIFICACFCDYTDNKDNYVNVFVNYLNGLPDQTSNYDEADLIKLEELKDHEYYIEIKVKASDKVSFSIKYQNCTGRLIDSQDGQISVSGAVCSDFIESWTENMEELVTDVTTNDGPIQLENEVQTENMSTSGERFIAVPRDRPTPCIGCASSVDPNAVGVRELASLGVKQLDRHEPNMRHSLNNVISVERQVQVIGGVRYIMVLTVDYDNCTSNETEGCNFQQTCQVTILEKPWQKLPDGSKFRAILSNNCTEEWLFDENELNNHKSNILNPAVDSYDNLHLTTPEYDQSRAGEDTIKAIKNSEVQVQPKVEKTLTDNQMRELEEQIIPNSNLNRPTDNNAYTVSDVNQDAHLIEEKANTLGGAKSSDGFTSTLQPESDKTTSGLSENKKKAIEELMNFFDFSGLKDNLNNEDLIRMKRDYGSDLQILNIAENYQDMKTKIKNAQFIHKLAQVMVDHLNEIDIEVKNRVLLEVTSAEEEFERDLRYFYVQARVSASCNKAQCKNREIKICNGIIDATGDQPSVLYTVCNNDRKKGLGQQKDLREDDPILLKFLKRAMRKIDMESKLPYALRLRKILSASTQRVSGVLTKMSVEIEYTECFKTVPIFRRSNCSTLQNLGFKLCDIEVLERHWLKETKMTYVCTDRPVDEIFISDIKNNISSSPARLSVHDPQVYEILQEALLHLETKSNRNNKQKIVQVKSVSTQQVAGMLTDIVFTVGYTACTGDYKDNINTCELLANEPLRNCTAELWERPWLDDGRRLNVTCEIITTKQIDLLKREKRDALVGSLIKKEEDDPQYKSLAEESLQKYLKESKNSQHYQLIKIDKVTLQLVSGTLTKIDFHISPTNCQVNSDGHPTSSKCVVKNLDETVFCVSEILERPWSKSNSDKKLIKVNCDSNQEKSRRKRSILTTEYEIEQNPNEYKNLADDCLTNYMALYGMVRHHKVIRINKVVKVNVTGDHTKIDFVAAPTNCSVDNGYPTSSPCGINDIKNTMSCHADVLVKPFLNGRIINVNCQVDEKKLRRRRQALGESTTQDTSNPKYKKLAEKALKKYLLRSQIIDYHEVVSIKDVTKQIVSGTKTKINFVASPTNCHIDKHGNPTSNICQIKNENSILRCDAEILEQKWLGKEDITVGCLPHKSREKRRLGGEKVQNVSDPKYVQLAEESLAKYVTTTGATQEHKIIRITKVTTQVVAGSLTRIDFDVKSEDREFSCHSEIWDQSWLKKKEITINCDPNKPRKKRQVPGGIKEEDVTNPAFLQLAEESLAKYVRTTGATQEHKIIRISKVTTQVVAGSLTRIDFDVKSEDREFSCHSEIWDQSWLKKKEITINCDPNKPRKKRQVPGGIKEKDVTNPAFLQLAEESLAKYVRTTGATQEHKIIRISKVTTQVVAGSLTRIDFDVKSEDREFSCHSEIWDQSWLKKKEITINCDPNKPRKKRQVPGGIKEKDVTNPAFLQLAEESLAKYVRTTGATQEHKIIRISKVTTQVVAGSLTRIDFDVQAEDREFSCHSEIWDQSWLKKKEITINCDPYNSRRRREIQLASAIRNIGRFQHMGNRSKPGGYIEEDPTKPKYAQLAKEALQKYLTRKNNKYVHKIIEIERVRYKVISGKKYEIEFKAAPTACPLNITDVALCDVVVDSPILYCGARILDKPWLKVKDIEVFCSTDNSDDESDSSEEEKEKNRRKRSLPNKDIYYKPDELVIPVSQSNKIDEIFKIDIPTILPNDTESSNYFRKSKFYNTKRYLQLAEDSLREYESLSKSVALYKVVKIHYANEEEDVGVRIRLDFTASQSNCSSTHHVNSNDCQIVEPKVLLSCHADIRYTLMLEGNFVRNIEVKCNDRRKRNADKDILNKTRHKRQIPTEEHVEDDLTYYYADIAMTKINSLSDNHNLYKLITVHDIRRTVHMRAPMVRMYLEIAQSLCLRDDVMEDLSACNELDGLIHPICYARIWPSRYDDLVIEGADVVCERDLQNFAALTGFSTFSLLEASIIMINAKGKDKYFQRLYGGEPYLVPTLDYNEPFKLSFLITSTNCTKEYAESLINQKKLNDFTCAPNFEEYPSRCFSKIYMTANSRNLRLVNVTCTVTTKRNKRSIPINPENVSNEDVRIQRLIQESLEKLEMGSVNNYKQRVLVINRYSTKLTAKRETTIDFDVGYTNCLKYEWVDNITSCEFLEHLPRRHCVSVVYENLWFDNGRQIQVDCTDDETPLEANMDFEVAQTATTLSNEALKHIEYKYPHPRRQKVVRIFSVEKQMVAGIHYRLKMEVGYTKCMALSIEDNCELDPELRARKFCRVNVWVRSWTNHPPSYRVTCDYQDGATSEIYHEMQIEQLFGHFMQTYKPSYMNDHEEMQHRYDVFKENVKKIHELNVYEMGTARYAVTKTADLTAEEFKSMYLGLDPKLRDENQVPMPAAEIPSVNVPDGFDWRDHDAVTEVKDQGSCGSCWAFSVTGNVEGQWKRHSGKLVSLSEQELLDCDKLDQGCNGGLPDNAYRAIEQLGGLETESDYPYEGENDKCAYNASLSRVQISGAVNISSNETDMAKWLVKNGPISIGINANAMQFYVGGVSHPWRMLCNPNNLDHGVLIVGYGEKDYPLFHKKLPYWIVKNSWGKGWGEQGYYRVYRGDGTCGVNMMASSALV